MFSIFFENFTWQLRLATEITVLPTIVINHEFQLKCLVKIQIKINFSTISRKIGGCLSFFYDFLDQDTKILVSFVSKIGEFGHISTGNTAEKWECKQKQ